MPQNRAERLFLVLEYLASASTPPTHAELVRAIGIHRSTLWDLLSDLRSVGYVDVIDRRYVLGPRMLGLVYRATRHANHLHDAITPTLEALAAAVGETAVYNVEIGSNGSDPGYCVPVAQVEAPNSLRYAATIGRPFSHVDTAAGRVFLAYGARPVPETLLQDPASPFAQPRELEDELERIRSRGYAINARDSTRAIAAPVRDPQGGVVGVFALLGPADRFGEPERAWPTLQRELEKVHRRMQASPRSKAS